MSEDLYVITGVTGHIGQRVAEKLLAQKKKVRGIGRSAEKLKNLSEKGVETFVANVENADEVNRAFQGAKAIFLMIPPNYQAEDVRVHQNRVSQAYENALKNSGVRYVVNLSSLGAHRAD